MSAVFTTGVEQHANNPKFYNYMANPINKCKSKMDAWYFYGNQWILKWTFEYNYFCNMI